jgi:hypothetical protein
VVDYLLGAAQRAGDVDADDDFVAPVGVLEVHRVEGRNGFDFARGELEDARDLGHRAGRDQSLLVLDGPEGREDGATGAGIPVAGTLDGGPRRRLQRHAGNPKQTSVIGRRPRG